MNEKSKGLLWGALIGSIAGSVTALLLTPKSGRELRESLADGARLAGDKVQETAEKLGEQGISWIGVMTDRAQGMISELQDWSQKQQSWLADGAEARISSFREQEEDEELQKEQQHR
ncbi:YtxH domain-containing protein [Paenibacillus sp. JSM ZJ436]|uniref:YtxH domain-containing protein n=1 Tax=Paenibacillus sp. JSM ZJ436 TaxID=3376190 RepID=UPI00378B6CD7